MSKEKIKESLHELKDEVYHAEEVIGGCWSPTCGDGQYPEVNKAFEEAKKALLNLFHVTEKALRPNKDDEQYQRWINRHGVKDDK